MWRTGAWPSACVRRSGHDVWGRRRWCGVQGWGFGGDWILLGGTGGREERERRRGAFLVLAYTDTSLCYTCTGLRNCQGTHTTLNQSIAIEKENNSRDKVLVASGWSLISCFPFSHNRLSMIHTYLHFYSVAPSPRLCLYTREIRGPASSAASHTFTQC